MVQSTFSIRLDEDTKADMDSICDSLGMSMSSAFSVFAKAFVRARGFPFDVRIGNSRDDDLWSTFLEARGALRRAYPEEPSLEDINKVVSAVRSRSDED